MGQRTVYYSHLPSPQTKAPWQYSRAVPGGGGQGEVRCGWLLRVIQFSFIVQLLEVIRDQGGMKRTLQQIQLTGASPTPHLLVFDLVIEPPVFH